jgi:hypothetical protein
MTDLAPDSEDDSGSVDSDRSGALEPLPQQMGLGPVGRGITAASASALGAAFPPAAPVIAGVVAALHSFGDKLNKQQDDRISQLLESASAASSLSPENVVRRLIERDDLTLLAAEAIDAAWRSSLVAKAAALGRSLGSILEDDALIDLESVWIRIVSTVEPAHIRVLQLFLQHNGTMGTGSTLWGAGPPMTPADVGEHLGLREAALPLVQDLMGAGLLMNPRSSGMNFGTPDVYGQSVQATPLAAQLFARLSEVGLAEPN